MTASMVSACLAMLVLLGGPRVALADTLSPPPAPGFETGEAMYDALRSGQLKFVGLPTVPDTITVKENLVYGRVGDRELGLDLYEPKDLDHPVPAIIFIHGGAWKSGDRHQLLLYAVTYAAKGYVTATISYRLSPEATYPAAVNDAKCAVRWLRANAAKYHVDPDKIAVSGNSAGGHLSMMVGYSSDVPELEGDGGHSDVSSRVQAVINVYGPIELGPPFDQGLVRDFLGAPYEEAKDRYVQASPLTHLSKGDPPTLILHGTLDNVVPISHADRLAAKLKELEIPYMYDRLEGWPHGMDIAQPVFERCRYFMDQFLAQYLPLPNPNAPADTAAPKPGSGRAGPERQK